MNKCAEYLDMLSAYADGELTDADRQRVAAHLETCSNCSALLSLYREIPAAVAEAAEPVPDALCIGVMNSIKAEKTPGSHKRVVNRRILLSRFMPAAACLVVALLAWSYFGDLFSLRNRFEQSSAVSGEGVAVPAAQDSAMYVESRVSINAEADADSTGFNSGGTDDMSVAAGAPSNTVSDEATGYVKISPDEAMQIMNRSEHYTILDVRTESEYQQEHIAGAVLIAHTEINEMASEYLADKDEIILVYCRTGVRSASAAQELSNMGYTRVYDIGGIADWPYETVK